MSITRDDQRPGPGEAADVQDGQLPRFMNARQAAAYLQINEKKLYELAAEGTVPATKVTGKWLFPRDLVDQWLVESSHGGVLADRLIISGSDDPLLERTLRRLAQELDGRALVSYASTGTRLGLTLLAGMRADVAAVHWGPAEESALRHAALLRGHRGHGRWVLVRVCLREQGLLVPIEHAGGNAVALLRGARAVARRQPGAGSQRFMQETLAKAAIGEDDLPVTETALSEREAASLVATGTVDLAPGIRAVANEFGLGFVATGWEAFDLAVERGVYFRTLFQRLVERLRDEETAQLASRLGGYDLAECGNVVWSTEQG